MIDDEKAVEENIYSYVQLNNCLLIFISYQYKEQLGGDSPMTIAAQAAIAQR